MNRQSWKNLNVGFRRNSPIVLQAMTFALLLALALPGSAFGERAVKTRVAPLYPELAKRMKIAGTVKMEVTVDAEGKVMGVKTLSGNRMLTPAAEDAVHKWKFETGSGEETVAVELTFAVAN